MRKTLLVITAGILLSVIFLSSIREANTQSKGAQLRNTGSPGDGANNTCAKFGCHVGTINSFPGSVNIDVSSIPASGYAPGVTYSLKVTVAESGRNTFGFQMTAEDPNQNKMGTYSDNSSVRQEFTNWVTHKITSSTGVFTFNWTAPFSNEDITFYAAGNAANGNGLSSGDHIYTSSATISRDVLATVIPNSDRPVSNIYNVVERDILIVDVQEPTLFYIYSINGQLVQTLNAGIGKTHLNISAWNAGTYIVADPFRGSAKRFVIR